MNDQRAKQDCYEGWLFLAKDAVPERWRQRAVGVFLVPLLPHEARAVLEDEEPAPVVSPQDEELLRLAARGLTVDAIASHLHLSARSVQRRLSRLREQFGVTSKHDLAAILSKRGF